MKLSWFLTMVLGFTTSLSLIAKNYSELPFERVSVAAIVDLENRQSEKLLSEKAQKYSYPELLKKYQSFQEERVKKKEFEKYLSGFYRFHNEFQKTYDEAYLLRHTVLIRRGWEDYIKFCQTLSPAEFSHTAKIRATLANLYAQWEQHHSYFGGQEKEELNKHRLRHFGFFYFFSTLTEFYELFYKHKPDFFEFYRRKQFALYAREPSSFLNDSLRATHKVAGGVSYAAGLSAILFPTLADLFVPTKAGSLYIPLSQKIDFIINREASLRQIKTSYYNRTNLPDFNAAGSKDLFLLLPDHHLGLADAALIAGLGIPNYLIFAKAREFAPRFFAQKLADHPQFIAVGTKSTDGRGSVEQLERALETQQSKVAINFPQGHLEPNQTIPINGAFSENLLKHFIDKGYILHIVPLKWHSPSPFPYDNTNLPSGFPINRVAGEVLPELPATLLSTIIEHEFSEENSTTRYENFFGILLRSVWIQKNTVFPDLSVTEMLRRIALLPPQRKT